MAENEIAKVVVDAADSQRVDGRMTDSSRLCAFAWNPSWGARPTRAERRARRTARLARIRGRRCWRIEAASRNRLTASDPCTTWHSANFG